MESILLQASFYLGAAVVIVPLSVRLGLGSVLGYLAAGLLLGPILGVAGEPEDLQHIAELGVVLMLFLIGLELEPHILWSMRHRLLGVGGMQIMLTAGAIAGFLWALHLPWQMCITIGLLLSLSSTAIVLQTLSEKNLLRSAGGRSIFAVLLSQDIAVVPMLALIPLLSGHIPAPEPTSEGAAEPLISLVQSWPGWAVTILTLGIILGIILAGHFLSHSIFKFVHASRLPEMGTFTALLMIAGIAFSMMLVGLSPALGTFIAGMVLANSEFRHQIEIDIKPFKGLLLGLFFMTVGANINLDFFITKPLPVLGLTLALIFIKTCVLYILATLSKLRKRDRVLFTLSLAQGGEFGFLLVKFADSQKILPDTVEQTTLLVISLSMLLTPLLFILYERLSQRYTGRTAPRAPDEIHEKGPVIIAGIGRFGQIVDRMVRSAGFSTVVLDADPKAIDRLKRFNVKGYFGDPSRTDLLFSAGLDTAQVLVVAIDDPDAITRTVHIARKARPDIHIIARAYDRVHTFELYQAGANDIIRETFDSSIRAGRYVLQNMGLTAYEADKFSQTYFEVDRTALRELAELWKPGVPVHLNPEYIARAQQFETDLQAALLDDQAPPPPSTP